jgi:hypothetical protein
MSKLFAIMILVAAGLMVSCAKHKNDIEDPTPKATIEFLSPGLGELYNKTDNITIRATAISTATIHGYDLIVRRAEDTAKIYFKHIHDHNDTLQISQDWNATASGELQAEILLYVDHDGHTASRKAFFRVR